MDELHKLLKFQAAGLVNLTGASILAVGAARLARVLKIDITTHTLRMPGDCLCRRHRGRVCTSQHKAPHCTHNTGNTICDDGFERMCAALDVNAGSVLRSIDASGK